MYQIHVPLKKVLGNNRNSVIMYLRHVLQRITKYFVIITIKAASLTKSNKGDSVKRGYGRADADGGRRTADGGLRMADGGWRMGL